jgi:hypothetical protein
MRSSTCERGATKKAQRAIKKPQEMPSDVRRHLQRNPALLSLVDQAKSEIESYLPDAKIVLSMDTEEPRRVVVLEVRSPSLTMDKITNFLEPLRREYNRRSLAAGGVLMITI